MARNNRHETILNAFRQLNGIASIRQISEYTGFNANGISQSLGVMNEHVEYLDGRGSKARWQLKRTTPQSH